MNKSYRIKTSIGSDVSKTINVNLRQDIDLYEILSLKLSQDRLYESRSADYGVIVGRVLANDAFGVPNARVSVFISLSDEDAIRTDISSVYPFNAVTDYDSNSIRYNLLPNKKEFKCHANVGTFPSKQLVLDDDTMLEVYDKYYRYTTVTNKSGDYMIFGVPVGQQVLHVDVDLSNIGLLSQTPRDMIYKGYSIDMFDSPVKFKKSTNLADLVQIHSENVAIEVYPFWGDSSETEVAITRKDINIQYKFEPTCIFLGSIITDNGMNAIGHNCIPDEKMGDASQLTSTEGTIEMIRKTIDGKVEEFPIKGNDLIDGSGVFCYQIPMNLDYVGMDEYGNIVPTNNPAKGIPTRCRARFRFTLKESGAGEMTTHTARYLVPNNPPLNEHILKPRVEKETVIKSEIMYEFGTLTPENCFRDLYWNKVYSVKGYIPRLQTSAYEKTGEYLAIKGVNKKGAQGNNIIPFNKVNLNFKIDTYYLLQQLFGRPSYDMVLRNTKMSVLKSIFWLMGSKSIPFNLDAIAESIIDETDAVGLDFYNDWLNGCLYFPAWHWRSRKKEKYSEGDEVYESLMCECREKKEEGAEKHNKNIEKLYLFNNCSLIYDTVDLKYVKDLNTVAVDNNTAGIKTYFDSHFAGEYHKMSFGSKSIVSGIIKKIINKDGGELYYYSFGNNISEALEDDGYCDYARLFSTDLILLGSLNDCDIDGVPKMPYTYPATTATIPPVGRIKHQDYGNEGTETGTQYEDDDMEEMLYHQNGMNWGKRWKKYLDESQSEDENTSDALGKLSDGLFFGLRHVVRKHGWLFTRKTVENDFVAYSDAKTCVNVERLCELGVKNEKHTVELDENNKIVAEESTTGMILKHCLMQNDTRALFATLNSGKLVGEKENETTGYKTYNLVYFYPTNFDGRLENLSHEYFDSNRGIHDLINKDYIDFRLGNSIPHSKSTVRKGFASGRFGSGRKTASPENVYSNSNGNFGGKAESIESVSYSDDEMNLSYLNDGKTAHFYGVRITKKDDGKGDSTFPFKNGTFLKYLSGAEATFEYAFPLYENSFYFYFGLNRGNTAIDKFYSEFYGECPDDFKNVFSVQINDVKSASVCGGNDGEVYYVIEEAEFPCKIELYLKNEIVYAENNINLNNGKITGLTNGTYKIRVIDASGSYVEAQFALTPNNVYLSWTVLNQIRTEYTQDKTCSDICSNNYHGRILFDKVTIEGEEHQISSLNRVGDGVYNLGTSGSKKARIKLKARGFNSFDSVLCTCTSPINANIMNIARPVTIDVELVQLCNGTESENKDFYTISITDIKLPELYINNVPVKFMVGEREDLLSRYNRKFHDGTQTTDVDNMPIKGWFGLHIPETYSQLFVNPTNDLNTWFKHTSEDTISDIINQKFTYMFSLSKAAYVTADNNNVFNVRIAGGNDTELLLRSGFPVYSDFLENNNENANEFNSYLTSSAGEVSAHTASPNIVSENYRYVDAATKYPKDKVGELGGMAVIIDKTPYDFNPKYANKKTHAGNYFAGFTRNAGIIDTLNGCMEGEIEYKSIPVKSHDLYRDGVLLCPLAERSGLVNYIYTPTPRPTYTYLRTEFIDRRFDFDMFFISPYSDKVTNPWSGGRISALTFNGIEMAYDKKKNIIGDGCEYSYNLSNGKITYKYYGPKRFYKSTLEYSNGKEIDIRDMYHYADRVPNDMTFDGGHIVALNTNPVTGITFYNFGLIGETVNGYPSKRWLNFYNIPYGDYYKFTNVSCSYDINLDRRPNSFAAQAVPGETVSFSVETGDLVKLELNDFEKDFSIGNYNILYEWCITNATGCTRTSFTKTGYSVDEGWTPVEMNASSTKVNKLLFRIVSTGTTNFASKIEDDEAKGKLGVRLFGDNKAHNYLLSVKTATTMPSITNTVISRTLNSTTLALPNSNPVDTTSAFIDYVFDGSNRNINGNKFINIVFDRYYYSTYADSLMKRLRVLNTSTMYDVSEFVLKYLGHKYISRNLVTITPKENINVDIEGSGDAPVPEGEVTVDITGSGTGNKDAEGTAYDKFDLLLFTIDGGLTGLNVRDIEDFCFKVTEPHETVFYKRYETDNKIVGNTIVIKWPLIKNTNLIKCYTKDDDCENNILGVNPSIELFLKMKNELVYYLEFKIKGDAYIVEEGAPEKLTVTIS